MEIETSSYHAKKHPVSIIRYFHQKIYHGGRDATLNEIRQNSFTIVNVISHVYIEIFKCVMYFRGSLGDQKIVILPS